MHELRLSPEAQRRAVALNARQAWISIGMQIPIMLALVVIFSIQNVWLALGYGILVSVLVIGGIPFSIWLAKKAMRETYIRFGDGWIEHHWMFRTRRFAATEATSVVTVNHMSFGGFAGAPTHHLIVTGHDRRLLLLVGQMWTQQQLTAIMQDLASRGVPWFSVPEPVTPAQLRERDPRLVPWWQAHPIALGLIIAGALLVFITLAVIIVAFAVFAATTR